MPKNVLSEEDGGTQELSNTRSCEEGDSDWKTLFTDEAAPSWSSEMTCLLSLSAPACLQLLGTMLLITTNQALVGHLGAKELAAASIASTFWYFLLGVATGLDSLASRAWGMRDRASVIAWTSTSAVVLSLTCLPIGVALWMGEAAALQLFRQPADISHMVGIYCQWMVPGLLPFVWAVILIKMLQAQNSFWPPAILTMVTCVLNVPMTILFIKIGGFIGAAAAPSAARIFMFLLVLVYLMTYGRGNLDIFGQDLKQDSQMSNGSNGFLDEAAAPLLSPEAVLSKDPCTEAVLKVDGPWAAIKVGCSSAYLLRFLGIGLPGGVMMAADASSFDITTAFASFLGTVEVDAHTVILGLNTIAFMSLPFAVSTAASIRVGNLLGAGKPRAAKVTGVISVAIGAGFLDMMALMMLLLRRRIGRLFVDDPDVIQMVASIVPLSAIWCIPDGFLGTIQGILRGMGKQPQMVVLSLAGFWGIGVPVQYILTFPLGWRLQGLWVGIIIGVAATAAMCGILLSMVDWNYEAAKARGLLDTGPSDAENSEPEDEDIGSPAQPEPTMSRMFSRASSRQRDSSPGILGPRVSPWSFATIFCRLQAPLSQ